MDTLRAFESREEQRAPHVERLVRKRLNLNDWEQLVALNARLLVANDIPITYDSGNDFKRSLFSRGSHVFGVRNAHNAPLVGMARLHDARENPGYSLYSAEAMLFDVSVLSGHENAGNAKRLVDACLAFARTRRIQTVGLEVHASNHAAIRVYTKAGFVLHSTRTSPQTNGKEIGYYICRLATQSIE